jgi:hypothetical protein
MNCIEEHLIELPTLIENATWCEKIDYLYRQQREKWNMARNHYLQFESVERRQISFGDFKMVVQHNPGRIRSTCAVVSKPVIENRRCFLCLNHLPEEQKGFLLLDKYIMLVNPFPIFSQHLTISDLDHTPQKIENRIVDLLTIARDLDGFTVFYNGPRCGASAPDHFHFQAGISQEMPIFSEIEAQKEKNGRLIFKSDDIEIISIENYLRSAILLESEYREPIDYFFDKLMKKLPFDDESDEPKVNLMANYVDGKFRLIVFPRITQRPSCYYREGDDRIVVSVASVELGGVIVVPREEDFLKITKQDLEKIFSEVSIDSTSLNDMNFETSK